MKSEATRVSQCLFKRALSLALPERSEPRSFRALSESIEHPDDYLGSGSVGWLIDDYLGYGSVGWLIDDFLGYGSVGWLLAWLLACLVGCQMV